MQEIPGKPLSEIWLKASVLGSIWASVEIILGSFLHNLKIPISGMVLSFISVWLLISFLQIWKENGLVIRAGLICALMKSISPSAVILGPMIGIMTEALLVELFILLFGKNIIGYIFAGAFAVLSALIQKVVSLLIMYGFDFLKILTDLYHFAVKQIGLSTLSPVTLLIVITSIYLLLGIAGALAGYFSGYRHKINRIQGAGEDELELKVIKTFEGQTPGQSYSILLLLLNILFIVLILFLLNQNYNTAALATGVSYIGFCLIKYRNSLKRLKKITFWLSFIIITFAAAFLWNGFSQGAFFSMDGLIIGLKMNARAVIIIIGFAGISAELKNPLIRSVLYDKGFGSLYQSLNLAFSALPFIISNLSKQGSNTASGISRKSLNSLFAQADTLLNAFKKEHIRRPEVVIITGDIHQGKTTFAQKVVSLLIEQGISIGGFLALRKDEKGVRTGFSIMEIGKGEVRELCSLRKEENRVSTGHFYFNEEAIQWGNRILDPEYLDGKKLVVIDELGPLELSGKGWNGAIEKLCEQSSMPHLWIVRKSILNKIVRKWNVGNVYVYDISTDRVEDTMLKLKDLIRV
jgi:nucleoside-triphosphatase THEP1